MEAITHSPQSHKSEPSHLIKSSSRLSQMASAEIGTENETQIPRYSVEFAPSPSPPKRRTPSSTPSKLSINRPIRNCIPLHELLILSPPVRKSRTRISESLEMVDDAPEHRRGSKNSCASPRNLRRSRRKVEHEDRDCVQANEAVKPRKKRQNGRSTKEKSCSSIPTVPSLSDNVGEQTALHRLGEVIWDLIKWRDVAKSSLWFGVGCFCFLASCFTKGPSISLFSVISQLGLLFLVASFISNTLHQRENALTNLEVKLTENDVLRVIRVVLPALNLSISKTRELFCGEPSTTLKVALFFLFGAEYGHLLTMWRLCTLGFFASFTLPKLYSSYCAQLHSEVEQWKWRVLEAWQACVHKKIVALSVASVFWNISGFRIRIFAAFVSFVILRNYQQHLKPKLDKGEVQIEKQAAPEEQGEETSRNQVKNDVQVQLT